MAYVINKKTCIGCGTCEAECPVNIISVDKDGKYIIKEDECIECGACEGVCPVDAIKG